MSNKLTLIYAIIQLAVAFAIKEDNTLIRLVLRKVSNSSEYTNIEYRSFNNQQTAIDFNNRYRAATETLTTIQTVNRNLSSNIRNWIATTTTPQDNDIDHSRFSEKFLNCSHSMVQPEFYEILVNGSVYVPSYFKIFNMTDYFIGEDRTLFICPEFLTTVDGSKIHSNGQELFTVIGRGISAVFIILHIIMFIFFKTFRNFPGYCLLSLCIALLMAYTGSFLQYGLAGRTKCSWVGIMVFYFYLASFFWMNAIAYDVWRSVRMATSKFRLMIDRPTGVRFVLYSTFSWGTPLLILFIAFIVDRTTDSPEYKLILTNKCWFQYKQALSVYFAVPFFTALFLNIMFYISSFCMISSARMKTAENKSHLRSRFLITVRLAVAMGLMWTFGLFAIATQAKVLWYFYAICSTLQGACVFFSFTFTEKIRKQCKRVIQKKQTCSTTPTQECGQFKYW